MRIELRPEVRSPIPGALAVGIIDGKPLSYVDRTPHIGKEPTTHAAIAEALADAVDEAAQRVFGGEWNGDLSRITGINRRTVTHDRIMKYGLPPWVIALVGRASAHPHPRALGFILLSLASLRDSADRETAREEASMRRISLAALDEAISIVRYVSKERGKAPFQKSSEG